MQIKPRKSDLNNVVLALLLIVGIAMLSSPAAAAPPTQEPPEYAVAPPAGRPSTHFYFYATGFRRNEEVAYWFTDPNGRIYGDQFRYRTHCYEGRADWNWQSPNTATPGMWMAVVRSTHPDKDKIERVIPFEILPVDEAPPDNTPAAGGGNPAPGTPGTAVLPQVGPPGTRFSFYATGFSHAERVGYWFNAPDGRVYSDDYFYAVRANDDRADWRWTSPADGAPGLWTVVARGKKSKAERVIQFEVLPSSVRENSPGVAVEPVSGPPDSRFSFSASGFRSREEARFWVNAPDGTQYDKDKYRIMANKEGVGYWNWKVPPDAPAGYWLMIIMGEESQTQKYIYFEVR